MTTVAIHQSQYLPWLPYFEKVVCSDIFVILDNVQFQKNGVQNRNQIKTAAGKTWLTVPVTYSFGQLINEVRIDNHLNWARKHWRSLEIHYAKAACFDEFASTIRDIYARERDYLVDLNTVLFGHVVNWLGIRTEIIRASELDVKGSGSDLILGLCKSVGADIYCSGQGAKDYLGQASFESAGIQVVFQEYNYPTYPQCYPELGFVKDLSVIDLLFNCGARSLEILMQGSSSSLGGGLSES